MKDADDEPAVKNFDRSKTELKELNAFDKSLKERITRASKFSKFDERSVLDQDDSYGNYRPKF
jgi:Ca2+-binding EF-hand superfamily protein